MRTQIGFTQGTIEEPCDDYVGKEVVVLSDGGKTHGILQRTCDGTFFISDYLIIGDGGIRKAGAGAVAIISSSREINILPEGTLDLIIKNNAIQEEVFQDGGGI